MKSDESTTLAIHKLSEAVHLDPTIFVAYEGEMTSFIPLSTCTCMHTHTMHACMYAYTHTHVSEYFMY